LLNFWSLSDATRAAYRSDMEAFKVWCDARGVAAVPASPEVVASFAASQAEHNSLVATPLPKVDVLGQVIEFLKIEAASQPQ